MLLQNTTENELYYIAELKFKYPQIFDKLISSKVSILSQDNNFQLRPLINLEHLALNNIPLNKVLSYGSFSYQICSDLGRYYKEYGKNLKSLDYRLTLSNGVNIYLTFINGKTILAEKNQKRLHLFNFTILSKG